jgi:hypothetical protein
MIQYGSGHRSIKRHRGIKMNFFDVNSEGGDASVTRRLIESAAVAVARGSGTSPAAALNVMRLPAIALDQHGFVAEVNAAAEAVFDNDFRIKDRRLFVRDPAARVLLKEAIDQLKTLPRRNPLVTEPIIVQRQDKLPVIVRMRIWRSDGAAHLPAQEVCALLTLNVLGPKPAPSAAILAKTFRLTPAEAKLACVIARGAPPDTAARELKISRETAPVPRVTRAMPMKIFSGTEASFCHCEDWSREMPRSGSVGSTDSFELPFKPTTARRLILNCQGLMALNVSAGAARFRQLSGAFRKTNAQFEIYPL